MKVINCTKDSPMPENRDQTGQHWFHVGAVMTSAAPSKIGDVSTWKCPNCGHVFTTTLRPYKSS